MKLTTSMLTGLPAQDVFDIAAWHMLQQNERAHDGGCTCRYRAADGLRCAVGWLIPDDEYRFEFEGCGVGGLIGEANKQHCSPAFVAFLMEHQRLLQHLQTAHDESPPDAWPVVLQHVALAHGLRDGVLDHFEAKRRARAERPRNRVHMGPATLTIGNVKLQAIKVIYEPHAEFIEVREAAIGMLASNIHAELAKAFALPAALLSPVTQEIGHEFAEHEETREAAPA